MLRAEDLPAPVTIDGDTVSYSQNNSTMVADGNVKMVYQDVTLYCDRARYDTAKSIAVLHGHIKIVRGEATVYGDDITYDFNKKEIVMTQTRMEFKPFYAKAREIERPSDEEYIFDHAYVTTCDLEKPHYRLEATRIVIYPKRKIVAHNVTMRLGDIPVFYFPYLSLPIWDDAPPFELSVGSDSDWGKYLLSRWRYNFGEHNRGKVHFDIYEDRGKGYGVSHKSEGAAGQALLNFYTVKDELYRIQERDDLFRKYPERAGLNSKYLVDDRYKAQIAYTWNPLEPMSITSELNKFSDEYFMKDFFYREYEVEPHPLSYTLANYSFSNSSLALLAQNNVNRFWSEVEYLPQLEYNFYPQNIGDTNFYFASRSYAGSLDYEYADSADNFSSERLYSHNVLSYIKGFGPVKVNPYIGNYSSFYSRGRLGERDLFRTSLESGAAVSTKFYKTADTDFDLMGQKIIKLRHVITPTIDYKYIHAPTIADNRIFQFDGLDALSRQETVTVTLGNKVQVKTKDRAWDLFYFSPAATYVINQEGRGSYFSAITGDLEFYPRPGVSLLSDAHYDCVNGYFDQINADLAFSDVGNTKYRLALGQRYSRGDSSQGTLDFTYQLTPKWQFHNYIRYEYRTREFKEQQYTLRRDLHCWWMDVGVKVNTDRDITLWVLFTLKAFPNLNFGFDHDYNRRAKTEY